MATSTIILREYRTGQRDRVSTISAGTNVTITNDEAGAITIAASGGGGGSSIILDLGDDDSNESTALGEIAITNDTNSIFTEPSDDKLLIDASQNWPTADTCDTIPNLTGHITSTGNATVLGSFTKSQLSAAVNDGTVLFSGDVSLQDAYDGGSTIQLGALSDGPIISVNGVATVTDVLFALRSNAGAKFFEMLQDGTFGFSGVDPGGGAGNTGILYITTASGASSGIAEVGVNTNVTNTELDYLNGVTSAIQTQIDGKQAAISFGAGVETFLGTPSSANLASAVTDETGSGALVFGTSPTIATPSLTGDIVFTERADHASTPSAGFGYLWCKNDAPNTLIFTDDAGTDHDLTASGSGDFSGPASSTDNAIVLFDGTGGKTGKNSTLIGGTNMLYAGATFTLFGGSGTGANIHLTATTADLRSVDQSDYFRAVDGTLTAVTNSTTRLTITDSGTSLNSQLDVNGNEIVGAIDLHSTGDIIMELGDAAGSNDVSIRDSGASEVVRIDSDGNVEVKSGDIVFTEKADHSKTPGAGFGYLWCKNTTPSTLIFTDDAGTDTTLGGGGGGSSPTKAKLSSDFDTSSGSFQDVTGLGQSVSANTDYLMLVVGSYICDNSGEGAEFGFNGPSTPDDVKFGALFPYNGTNAYHTIGDAFGDDGNASVAGSTVKRPLLMWCYLENGANSGTLYPTLKAENGSVADVTIEAGTVSILYELS